MALNGIANPQYPNAPFGASGQPTRPQPANPSPFTFPGTPSANQNASPSTPRNLPPPTPVSAVPRMADPYTQAGGVPAQPQVDQSAVFNQQIQSQIDAARAAWAQRNAALNGQLTGSQMQYQLGNQYANQMFGLNNQDIGLQAQTIYNNSDFVRAQMANNLTDTELLRQQYNLQGQQNPNYDKQRANIDAINANLDTIYGRYGQIYDIQGQQRGNLDEQLANQIAQYQHTADVNTRDINSKYTAGGNYFAPFHGEKLQDVGTELSQQTTGAQLATLFQQLGIDTSRLGTQNSQTEIRNRQLDNTNQQLGIDNSKIGNQAQQIGIQRSINNNELQGKGYERDLANLGVDLDRLGLSRDQLKAKLDNTLAQNGLSGFLDSQRVLDSLGSNNAQLNQFLTQLIYQAAYGQSNPGNVGG